MKARLFLSLFTLLVLIVSSSIKLDAAPNARSCTAEASPTSPDSFNQLTINGTDIITSRFFVAGGYVDYTDQAITISAGDEVSLYANGLAWYSSGNYSSDYTFGISVLVDFNQDGDFEDEGELIGMSEPGVESNTYDALITFPEDIDGGEYRMCVIGDENSYSTLLTTGCGSSTYSMIVDLTLIVKPKTPEIVDLFPASTGDGVAVFSRGFKMGNPWLDIKRTDGMVDVSYTYKVVGPLPLENVIYEASTEGDVNTTLITPNPQPLGEPERVSITHATGIAAEYDPTNPNNTGGTADPDNTGIFDLQTNQLQIEGGSYRAIGELKFTFEGEAITQTKTKDFVIAIDNDIAITAVRKPIKMPKMKYGIDVNVPITATVTNVGLNDVSEFELFARVYPENGTNPVFETSKRWTNTSAPLTTGDMTVLELTPYRAQDGIGNYRIEFELDLISAFDEAEANNVYPKAGQAAHLFEVAYNHDVQPIAVLNPTGTNNYVGRPIIPRIELKNNGILDLSNVPATLQITGPNGYNKSFEFNVEVVPSGIYNTMKEYYTKDDELFIPPVAGVYTAKLLTGLNTDQNKANDLYEVNFTVIPSLSGTYTIGTTNASSPRNFTTIAQALDMVYTSGVYGPVTFELTDAVYNVGSKTGASPAMDLSSHIIGGGIDHPIVFKPSQSRAVSKGSVTINLHSGNGIGIYIAQNVAHTNSAAAVNVARDASKRNYANSEGYITFDGGSQKSFKFTLDTDEPFKAVFYLGDGASNNTITNCIIEGNGTEDYKCSLPLTVFSAAQGGFRYEPDKRSNTLAYTAGVVMRSKAPIDAKFNSNQKNLDTLTNNNNTITNNEITGFAYGVASMGIGQLLDQGLGYNVEYFNTDNTISHNNIHNVGRAGVFVGHEKNSEISNNRIFDIEGGCSGFDAAGIMAGGQAGRGYFGYNNRMVKIINNEISSISGTGMVSGIRVEQSPQQLMEGTLKLFPRDPEQMVIAGNIVWELLPEDANTARAGIYLFTQRNGFDSPYFAEYSSRNDVIVNNTVIVNGDDGVMNTRAVMGVGLQNVSGTILKNNAIAAMDNEYAESCPVSACVFYQGPSMEAAGIEADRNVYWTENSSSSVYRWIETDSEGNKLSTAPINEYKTLSQWQVWSGEETYSVYSKFMTDYEFVGTNPQNLRVKSNPVPLNSILNNRGDRLDNITADITGKTRGDAGQRFDIGALEFGGRVYVSDMEATTITAPAAYRATEGIFADAEHIMTKAPVEVSARLRNNGSLFQTGTKATVKIYRELPTGMFGANADYEETIAVEATTDEYVDVDFMLADGKGLEFEPETYADLRLNPMYAAAVPEVYSEMTANVTPRYKIEVILENDEDNTNNVTEKIVRFFVTRSWMDMLVSSEFVNADLSNNPTQVEIAGKLNHDRITDGLGFIGWHVAIDPNATTIANDTIDYDVLDRNCWEERAVDYNHYRTVLWSDTHDEMEVNGEKEDITLNRFEALDIKHYFASGVPTDKKNFIVGSQEMIRNNGVLARNLFRATDRMKANPEVIDYTEITGSQIGRNLTNKIIATGFAGDAEPNPALVDMWDGGTGNIKLGYYYTNELSGTNTLQPEEKIMGVGTVTLGTNVCYLGADWRHFADIEKMLRSVFDFVEAHNGTIYPIELAAFNADAVGARVDLNWSTMSELESDRFEIERTEITDGYSDLFSKVGEVAASGTSYSVRNYNTVDYGVEFGKKYAYRLKMIERNGAFEYSNIEEVEITSPSGLTVGEVLPNPVSSEAKVKVNGAETANIYLSDMSGRRVAEYANGNFEGNEIVINASNLSSGSYTLVIEMDGVVITRKVNVVK